MRLASGDVRDHIFSHKNDHGPSYRRYGVFLRWRRQKINFRGIFGARSIFDFATVSARKRYFEWVDLGYSITSSARAKSIAGTSRPMALAVFRLMTNSNLID
jgi:hypothetical protein